MKKPASFIASALIAVALAPAAIADGLNPGSVLVYPFQRSQNGSGDDYFTVICVTNIADTPITPNNGLGGSTNIHYEYVNQTDFNGDDDSGGAVQANVDCSVFDRIEFLTPADTKCVLTNCHNASGGQEGYLVVSAQDPNFFNVAWSHDYLIGSELVVSGSGVVYTLNAIPFEAIGDEHDATDIDGGGDLDFDELEYEGIARTLYIDNFVAAVPASLVLINMTGGLQHVATVAFDIWNDNEFPLSATLQFECWTEGPMDEISLVFTQNFLKNNTPDDASELDLDCDGSDDVETGWARIRGLNASSVVESIQNPAILGAIADGLLGLGGRRLWESRDNDLTSGSFFNTGVAAQ